MAYWENYDAVLDQLHAAGLHPRLPLETGKTVRCKVDGDREKRGWYILHAWVRSDQQVLLTGSFGIWHGNDNGATKIDLGETGSSLTAEQRKALAEQHKKAAKLQDQKRKALAAVAARQADRLWHRSSPTGEHDYLTRKGIQPLGVRFTAKGGMLIPMMDTAGRIHGLQVILSRTNQADRIKRLGRDKEYWPAGLQKQGNFYLIGIPHNVVLIAEGYATAASIHLATGLPVAVAFDAGNLTPVARALAKRYPQAKALICADDDSLPPDRPSNPGIEEASTAALAVNGAWIAPKFTDQSARLALFESKKTKLTDFNDLHLTDGLTSVRLQIEGKLSELGWSAKPTAAREDSSQGGGDTTIRPFQTTDELLERFSLVYGHGGTVFDHQEHLLMALSDMREACTHREIHRRWSENPARSIVRVENVGFDPAGTDPGVTCNLWAGWPTKPKKGSCENLLDLLRYLCAGDDRADDLYQWVLRWLAYPLQHPGAKMKTTLVVHGPQGTGKNLFFECVMAIYGRYGRIIDQSAVEDKFNDCFSRKLFLIADEVVARTELFHVKNKLKSLITSDWIRINPKNLSAYDEQNHVNLVFLSNERLPTVLEDDDRRHTVIWTPQNLGEEFYIEAAREAKSGGIEALHDHLLNLDLAGFNTHTKPMMTKAKEELIDLCRSSVSRFARDYLSGEIIDIDPTPGLTSDYYALYRTWCQDVGVGKPRAEHQLSDELKRKHGFSGDKRRYILNSASMQNRFLFPPKRTDIPDGKSEKYWLGDCVERFREAVKNYRDSRQAYV